MRTTHRALIGMMIVACTGVILSRHEQSVRSAATGAPDPQAEFATDRLHETRTKRPVSPANHGAPAVHGVVRARAGGELADATVCVVTGAPQILSFDGCIDTDHAGRFSFAELPRDGGGLLASMKGYHPQLAPLSASAKDGRLIIELDGGDPGFTGQVLDASGGLVRGAIVTLRGDADVVLAATLSDVDGEFEVAGSPRATEVCAQAEAYSRTCATLGAAEDERVLVLTPESKIVGRVRRRADASAIPGASIIASNRDGLRIPARVARSGDDGNFTIGGLPAGGYDVVAVSDDSRSVEQWVAVGLGETSEPVTLWADPAVRVSGVVLDTGTPCASGSVELSGPVWTRGRAGAGGRVELDGIIPGRYDATANCDGALSQTTSIDVQRQPVEHVWDLEHLPGAPSSNELVAASEPSPPKGGTLRALIDGEPASVLGVIAESTDGFPRRAERRGSEFILQGLPTGSYRVYVNDYVERAEQVHIARDGDRVDVRLQSTAPAWIRGRVQDEGGMPVADAWVNAFRSDLLNPALAAPPTLTDEEGVFDLPAVPGARYTLQVASPLGNAQLHAIQVGAEVIVRVRAPASLSGRVQTSRGESVPDFTLTYQAEHEATSHQRRGAESRFYLSMLEPGAYTVQVSSPLGFALERVRLEPRARSTVTLTLTPR